MGVFILLFLAAVTSAVVQNSHRSSGAAWKSAADHLQLHHAPGNLFAPPRIHGTVRGVAVRVEVLRRRRGSNNNAATVYTAVTTIRSAPPVVFRRQHTASMLRRFVGGHDVVVGDPRFDDSIVVDTADDRAIADYLTPARRAAILSVFSTWHDVDLSNRGISVATRGRANNAVEIVSTVNRLVDTSRVLADHQALDTALAHRDDGELHAAAAALHELNAEPDPNVITQMLEAETLVASGDPARAVEIVDQVADRLPADPEVERWRDFLAETSEPSAPDPLAAAVPTDLSQQAVIDDLFADTRYGVSIDTRYAEAFAGREVTWTGTVEQSREYRSDADFGTEPGTKTTVSIGSVGSSRLMSNQVKAIVDLPEGTAVTRGDTISFRGTLLHVDRFTRQFYVRDAQVV